MTAEQEGLSQGTAHISHRVTSGWLTQSDSTACVQTTIIHQQGLTQSVASAFRHVTRQQWWAWPNSVGESCVSSAN